MTLSDEAKELFEYLPEDGTKVGGITAKKDLKWGTVQFQKAKDALREEGLVAFGRGRGGSIARVEGKEIPQGPTPQERMAVARAAKASSTRISKLRERVIERARAVAVAECPDADKIEVALYDTPLHPLITVWKDGIGQNYALNGEEWICD